MTQLASFADPKSLKREFYQVEEIWSFAVHLLD